MKKVEFGPKDGLSKKAYEWYSGSTVEVYVDTNGIYYIGGSRERIGTLAELDAAFCQYQNEVDAME